MKKVLALDFDGVVADSILECLVTAYNAFSAFNNINDFRLDISQFTKEEIAQFRESRIYIRRGEDYVFLLMAADHGTPITSQTEFDTYLKQYEEVRDRFREMFYGMRVTLQTNHPTEWLALSPVYTQMKEFLQSVKHPESIYIVTTKDLVSVQLILESHDITLKINNMFQATRTLRKPELLLNIAEVEKLNPANVIFIDDHPATVTEVIDGTSVESHCAAWGYNAEDQLDKLKEMGVSVLTQDEFLSTMEQYSSQFE